MADGAIFHCDVSTISRSSGRSSVAAAAYRAGTMLDDARTGLRFDYTRKKNVVNSFIVAPDGCDWITDRETLWNAAEAAENRKNSVTAREWMVALPDALDATQQAELARAFAVELATRFGVAVDVAIHDASKEGDERNKHFHLLSTTRIAGPDGLGEKTRILDAAKTGGVEIASMREWWAGTVNDALEAAQSEARVDHRRKAVVAAEKQELAEALEAQAVDVATLTAKPAEVGGLWAGLGHAARAFRSSGLAAFFATGVTVEKLKAKAQELRKDVKRLSKPPAVHRGPALNAFVRRREAAEARVRAAEEAKRAEAAKQAEADRLDREKAAKKAVSGPHKVWTPAATREAREDERRAVILEEIAGFDAEIATEQAGANNEATLYFLQSERNSLVKDLARVPELVAMSDEARKNFAIAEEARKAREVEHAKWIASGGPERERKAEEEKSRQRAQQEMVNQYNQRKQDAERARQEAARKPAPSPSSAEQPKLQAPRPKPGKSEPSGP